MIRHWGVGIGSESTLNGAYTGSMGKATRDEALRFLEDSGIGYREAHHGAVFHVGDAADVHLDFPVVKSLMIHVKKSEDYAMCVLLGSTSLDLHKLASVLGVGRGKLTFAARDDLPRLLGVEAGTVTPLAVSHDNGHHVHVIFDKQVAALDKIGVHPNVNTSTVLLERDDMMRALHLMGHDAQIADIADSD